jgi:glucosylceramidase
MKMKITTLVLLASIFACVPKEKETPKIETAIKKFSVEKASVYRTAKATGEKLAKVESVTLTDYGQPPETQPCVFIDPLNTFQEFVGIGGALTDASAEVFAKLPEEKQNELLTAYYNAETGIGYNFSRTNIASCDFSSGSYDYVAENDSTLSTFSIDHDKQFKIPLIKMAFEAAGGNMKMFVSPWSPPAWMKDNNNRLRGGKLLEQFKQPWANHYIKFIQAYEAEGIPVWGLSVQNEPMAVQKWESCVFTAEDERDFVKKYLGPTLEKSGMSDKKLIVWDHNRDLIYQRASTIFNDPEAAKYIWGIGFHWYETWTGSDMQFYNLKAVNETFPDKHLLFTEGCAESFATEAIYEWRLGERYGYSMLNDFNNGTVAWTDWNILLDEQGGPNHVQNFCFAPVHANTVTGELIYTNSYYYIGHFSKFIKPGAKRIASSASRDVLQTTAFMNPDGKIVVVVLNTTDQDMSFKLWCQNKAADMQSLAHSIMTVVTE